MDKVKAFVKNNKDVLVLFLLAKIISVVIFLISHHSFYEVLSLYDGEHYISIANNGYSSPMLTAFFPVVPLLIRYIGQIGVVIVNNLAFLVSLLVINKLLTKYYKSSEAFWVTFALAVGSLGFFSSILYTESLYFMLTSLAFYLFCEKKHGLPLGIVLGLAVATRNTGSMLFFAIFIGMCLMLYRKEIKFKTIVITYIPATLISILYPAYLQIKFGNWKMFMDVQFSDWLRVPSNIFNTVYQSILVISGHYTYDAASTPYYKLNECITLVLLALMLTLIVREALPMIREKRLIADRLVTLLFSLAFLFAITASIKNPALDTPTASYPRFYMATFPFYTMLRNFKTKTIQLISIGILLLSLLTTSLFAMDIFFY